MLKRTLFTLIFMTVALFAEAATVKGIIVDKATREPLVGATLIIANTTTGVVAGLEGDFQIEIPNGKCNLIVAYVSYTTLQFEVDVTDNMEDMLIEMETSALAADEVKVIGRKNLETIAALQQERRAAVAAIENLGSKEMSLKGISNVEEGVKKMTGISVASAGQIVVRGLGDRYSITTLNGQPIASPNPDNKLAPLDIFPSSAVKNITVSKVYNATSYADYSGAHIDIVTKDQRNNKFFTVGLSAGGHINTIGQDFYRMDHASLFSRSTVSPDALSCSKTEFESLIQTKNVFDTDFSVESKKSLPTFGGNIGYGNSFDIGNQKLSVLATGSISNGQEISLDNEYKVMEATGTITDSYVYDSYNTTLEMAGLVNVGLTLRENDYISYTGFYARNAEEGYQLREGDTDNQGHIFSSNSVTHIYDLFTNQIHGIHSLTDSWRLGWDATYTKTSSDEPDRRQVMFAEGTDYASTGNLILHTADQQSTMRYFGELQEDEANANLFTNFTFGDEDKHKLTFGSAYKDKNRDYAATRFYYSGLYYIRDLVDGGNMFNTNGYLNQSNIENGTIGITRNQSYSDQYDANMKIMSAYSSLDLALKEDLLLNVGLRYENATQTVNYYGVTNFETETLKSSDFFPALNLRYNLEENEQVRLSFSRTVTRPSFIEMAPFLYQESYGSAQVIGNADLENGYNYNLDARYESFFGTNNMFSATIYYKRLLDPIERVQQKSGGATQQTFLNAENGVAAGVELEFRKTFADVLTLSLNGSFMYTDVKLSDGGVYTNSERQLQGASPYLVNADIAYTPKINDRQLSLALLYNLQGPRIYAVGIMGNADVIQDAYNKLNFVASYELSKRVSLKAELSNILNEDEVYRQESYNTGENQIVGRYNHTMGASVGVSLNF
ncbi:MAG: TonB-dependent receptor [Rikenellaceae bacterium]